MHQQQEIITMLEDSAKRFISDHATSFDSTVTDAAQTNDSTQLWQAMAEQGWLGLSLPESHHGAGLGIAEITALTRLFGQYAFATRFIANNVIPSAILEKSKIENSTVAALCEQLTDGSACIALAWQEQHGQQASHTPSSTLSNGSINGKKVFVAGAELATHFLVSLSNQQQRTIAVVDRNAKGVSINIDYASDTGFGSVEFNQVSIEDNAILLTGEDAITALEQSLQMGQIALAAELEGIASGCLEKTIEFVQTRKQFKQTIGSFQAIRHRSVDLLITTRLAESSWRKAVREYQENTKTNSGNFTTSQMATHAAKARCAEAAFNVAKESVQMHGAMGFTEESGIGNYLRLAITRSAWLGSARQHRQSLLQLNSSNAQPLDNSNTQSTEAKGNTEDLNLLPDETFRQCFRSWLEEHYPRQWTQSHHRPFLRFHGEEMRLWLKKLNDHGWRAPDWPKEHGGLALSFRKQLIYKEELNRIGAGRIVDNGETQLGPTLIKFGTDEQKAYFLPRILNSDDHWAQGYSEPNAGSDLASLSTKADLDGDQFTVNGQKIWTTFAQECDYIYMLVRTGRFEKKQQGISFLLIDLKSPGVTIRPILNIAGETELCEVFFDDVKVPAKNLVGELHQGWTIAKSLLGHERIWIGDPAMAMRALALSHQLVKETHQQQDAAVMERLATLSADLHDYRNLYADICDQVAETNQIGFEASMLKVFASELLQRISEFNVSVAEEYALSSGDINIGGTLTNLPWQLMMTRPTTIYAGCNEVQRDILAAGMGLRRA